MHLTFQTHVCQTFCHHFGRGNASGQQPCARGIGQIAQDRLDRRGRTWRFQPHRMAAYLFERQRCREETERRRRTGCRRDQHLLHAQHARDFRRMGRAGTAEANHGIGARVATLFHDMDARGGGHVLHHHAVDAPGGVDRRQT